MRKHLPWLLTVLAIAISFATVPAYAADTAAQVTCKDGSTSNAGKGACSHHGGVQKKADASGASAATEPAPKAKSTKSASNGETHSTSTKSSSTSSKSASATGKATAKCKDGTMSHAKNHEGACSHHGGVAQWLDE